MATKVKYTVDYDEAGDILYVFDGKPYPTINRELDRNFVLRLDSRQGAVVGLMVHRFSDIYPGAAETGHIAALGEALLRSFAQLHREKKLKEASVA